MKPVVLGTERNFEHWRSKPRQGLHDKREDSHGDHDEESVAMDKSKARPRGPSTPNPKRMGVGPESPRESQKEEDDSQATHFERSTEGIRKHKHDPKCLLTLVPETSAVGPKSPHETNEKESGGGDQESTTWRSAVPPHQIRRLRQLGQRGIIRPERRRVVARWHGPGPERAEGRMRPETMDKGEATTVSQKYDRDK